MKEDKLLVAICSFLVPIIFLYGFFLLAEMFVGSGFFALFLSLILFACAAVLYSLNHSFIQKAIKNHLKLIKFLVIFSITSYLILLVASITDLLTF